MRCGFSRFPSHRLALQLPRKQDSEGEPVFFGRHYQQGRRAEKGRTTPLSPVCRLPIGKIYHTYRVHRGDSLGTITNSQNLQIFLFSTRKMRVSEGSTPSLGTRGRQKAPPGRLEPPTPGLGILTGDKLSSFLGLFKLKNPLFYPSKIVMNVISVKDNRILYRIQIRMTPGLLSYPNLLLHTGILLKILRIYE